MNTGRIKIINLSPVGEWVFEDSEKCRICRLCKNTLTSKCIECKSKQQGCDVIRADCKHLFHYHCIQKWIKSNATCPYCFVPFCIENFNIDKDSQTKNDFNKLLSS